MTIKDKLDSISDEMLSAYLDGNTTKEETELILNTLKSSKELQEVLALSDRVDSYFEEDLDSHTILPITHMAADGIGNLCDLQCEKFILDSKKIIFDDSQIANEAKNNFWLKEKGTPLYNIGRLLEQKGLIVVRKYQNSISDIINLLKQDADIIVVLNRTKLSDPQTIYPTDPNHAVVIVGCNEEKITIFDPSSKSNTDTYPLIDFKNAWLDSCCYMVYSKGENDYSYSPQPIDIDDIELNNDLLELREAIAENAHDIWAAARFKEGWSYGPQRDDNKKKHPDLQPYAQLPESEKNYDRKMAVNTIKLIKKVGFDFVKHENSELYHLLISRLNHQQELSHCAYCSSPIFKDQVYCSQCGHKIEWDEWYKSSNIS